MRTFILTVTVGLVALLAGCTGSGENYDYDYDYEYVDDPPSSAAQIAGTAASQRPVTAGEIAGHWDGGEYGDTYIQVRGTEVRIVYGSGGRVLGTLSGATLVGWWTDTPTRRPVDDAGQVRFTFGRDGGKLVAQGQWRGGTSGEFANDWTMTKVDDVVPAQTRTVFADNAQFIRHP